MPDAVERGDAGGATEALDIQSHPSASVDRRATSKPKPSEGRRADPDSPDPEVGAQAGAGSLPAALQRYDYAGKTREVQALLEATFGRPTPGHPREPMAALVRAIVGQNTSHPNQQKALARLAARFPALEAVAHAPLFDVIDCLHPAGLANQKAPRLQALIEQILEERGSLDLGFLGEMEVGEAQAWLRTLPGVGPLTAALVLLFALHRPALPVNTGIHRVVQRVGLVPPGTSPERSAELLQGLLRTQPGEPPSFEEVYTFHINMVQHADTICRPGRPRCGECPLAHLCRFAHGA